jgi:hypothetical protein
MKPTEWVTPKTGLKYRVTSDPSIATGIYRDDGSMVTNVEIGSEREILASRRLATGVRDKRLKHVSIALDGFIRVLAYPGKFMLKIFNSLYRGCKLLLQRFYCGRAHKHSDISETNAEHTDR